MKKIFYYPFLILFFLVVFFSFGEKVFAETCQGLLVNAGGGGDRCNQASQTLKTLLSCLYTKDSSIVITSIGDNPGVYDTCLTNWNDPQCAHHKNSCHYGGQIIGNSRQCSGGSYAVDLRSKNLTTQQKQQLVQYAQACGANAFLELPGQEKEHVHASINSTACGCGESQTSASVFETIKSQTKDLCIDFNVPIPGIQEFLTQKCPDDDSKYLVTSETVALYINAVYKYGAGFAGLVAIFMIVFAAWQWIMAAGNSGKIDNAKDTIIASLVGLTLLFGGYLLLSQISSRLVNLKSLEIKSIDPRFFGIQECQQIQASCGQVSVTSSGVECMGQTCSSGETCMEVATGFTGKKCPILKDDLTSVTHSCGCQLPADELNCDIFNAYSRTCEDYNNPSTCNNNFCRISDGPCVWDVLDNSCQQVDDASCNNDNDCGVVRANDGQMIDTCCDVDDAVNNCEFPSSDPDDHCGD